MRNSILLHRAAAGASVRSISDDDACAECSYCSYHPGGMSSCEKGWPGVVSADGYILTCPFSTTQQVA